jgi:arylsulfatase A-like enzyme
MLIGVTGVASAGQSTDALVEFVDMYPTLCDLCGLPIPDHCEGLSYVSLLEEPDRPWKTAAFSQYPRRSDVMGYTVRSDRFRYTEWQERDTGEVLARELYDHRADPQENVNAVARPEVAESVACLSVTLHRGWRAALPDQQKPRGKGAERGSSE